MKTIDHLTIEVENTFASVLEHAANNDVEGFQLSVERDPSTIDEVGDWYGRKKVIEQRTPLMVAATYGSIDVLKLILKLSSIDLNRHCGLDKTTALHCAASGGSVTAVETIKILLSAGADPNCVDVNGHRPSDVIVAPHKCSNLRATLEQLLGSSDGTGFVNHHQTHEVSSASSNSSSVVLSLSPDEDGSPSSGSTSSSNHVNFQVLPIVSEKKEYPVDPAFPDIKNSVYATDEFRMFSFKVRPCSRAYSHDWTECPFVHPGENARRRDPRKYHYSCVPCPEFRKGACRRGDMCEYAHGVFECWLHPAQYRTRLCKDGTSCARRVCFFAHTNEELRPLYLSTGLAVPSPRSSASVAMEMAAIGLMPGSPVSSVMSPFTSPLSPSTNGISHSSINWPQPNIPALHLPGGNLQSSRLRSSLNARDMHLVEYLMQELEAKQLFGDAHISRCTTSPANKTGLLNSMAVSNLDELLCAEISSSSRFNSEKGPIFSPSYKSAILNQFQQQHQCLLSPIKTGIFSPTLDQQLSGHSSLLQASFGSPSPGRMSPRSMDPVSPMSSHIAAFAQREKQLQQTLRSLSSRDLGSGKSAIVGLPVGLSSPKWASPSGVVDWGMNGEELGQIRRSSFELRSSAEEPDISWVHSLVKESPPEKPTASIMVSPSDGVADDSGIPNDGQDHAAVYGAWLEQMQQDQMVA